MPIEDHCNEGTAAYVVCKGREALEQGRQLTLPFQGIADPQEAFKQAAFAWVLAETAINSSFHADITVSEPGVFEFTSYARFGSVYDHIEALVRTRDALLQREMLRKQEEGFLLDLDGHTFSFPNCQLQATLNNTVVRVDLLHEVPARGLCRDWDRVNLELLQSPIGPQVAAFGSADKLLMERAKLRRLQQFEATSGGANAARSELLEVLEQQLASLRPVEYKDEELWRSAKSVAKGEMSQRIFAAVEAWMQLMQAGIDRGQTFAEMAMESYRQVDVAYDLPHNSTGAMVNMISSVWLYGTSFRAYWTRRHFTSASTEAPPKG